MILQYSTERLSEFIFKVMQTESDSGKKLIFLKYFSESRQVAAAKLFLWQKNSFCSFFVEK